jgi:hypothetical protein
MPKADAEFQTLQAAMDETPAACADDPRFILDDDVLKAAELAEVCDRCSILAECAAYARAARPMGGVWASKRWHTAAKKKETV